MALELVASYTHSPRKETCLRGDTGKPWGWEVEGVAGRSLSWGSRGEARMRKGKQVEDWLI